MDGDRIAHVMRMSSKTSVRAFCLEKSLGMHMQAPCHRLLITSIMQTDHAYELDWSTCVPGPRLVPSIQHSNADRYPPCCNMAPFGRPVDPPTEYQLSV